MSHGCGRFSCGLDEERLGNNNSLSAQRGLQGDMGLIEGTSLTEQLSFLAVVKCPDQREDIHSFIHYRIH